MKFMDFGIRYLMFNKSVKVKWRKCLFFKPEFSKSAALISGMEDMKKYKISAQYLQN